MAKDLRTAGEVAQHLQLNMPSLKQAVAYWSDADGKLGGADHTEIFRYAEMLAEEEVMSPAFTLDTTYIHLRPDESALAMEGGRRFWQHDRGAHDLDEGRLMGRTHQSKDWDHWERHPGGEEILILLSGEMDIVLETGGEQRAGLGGEPAMSSGRVVISGTRDGDPASP